MHRPKRYTINRTVAMCLLMLSVFWNSIAVHAAPSVVTVQISSTVIQTSALEMGITHTHQTRIGAGDKAMRARVNDLLNDTVGYQNQHIMGWGVGNPEPTPGNYDFASLDARIAQMQANGAKPVITLCCAPDWMKGGQPGSTDWAKLEDAPRPDKYDDFAKLAAVVAKRYPQVQYFQIWNEFKGFWDTSTNNWNYRAYTDFYNHVYKAVKQARPDAKVGGFYMVIEGTGSNANGDWARQVPLTARQDSAIDYWLANKAGADFICVDKAIKSYHDGDRYTTDQFMRMTDNFGVVAAKIRAKTDLPIWWSEYYVPGKRDDGSINAGLASVLMHMLRNGSNVALLWQEYRLQYALYNRPGERQPVADVVSWFHKYFGPGAPIYQATSSDPLLEVLASAPKTMLINKENIQKTVLVNGQSFSLNAYEVQLINTPRAAQTQKIDDSVQGNAANQFVYTGAGWQHCSNCEAAKFQQGDSWNSSAGEYATLTFYGSSVTLYGAKAPHHGIAAISIDGGSATRVDYYAARRADNQSLWSSPQLAPGLHTLKVRVTGTKNPASTGTVITIDHVDVKS